MRYSFPGASLVGLGLLSLLAACANTPTSGSDTGSQKVASANCEVVSPTIGSNMTHRSCIPAPASTTSDKSSTSQ